MGTVIGIIGVAVLFAAFGLMQRGRERDRCSHCHCSGEFCERDGHRIREVTESTHAKS